MLMTEVRYPTLPYPEEMLPINDYQHIHVCVSGGVDSTVALIYMLYAYNVPKEKITLVHMRIDGPEENDVFFDYPETAEYLDYLMRFFNLPLVILSDKKGLKQRIEERGML